MWVVNLSQINADAWKTYHGVPLQRPQPFLPASYTVLEFWRSLHSLTLCCGSRIKRVTTRLFPDTRFVTVLLNCRGIDGSARIWFCTPWVLTRNKTKSLNAGPCQAPGTVRVRTKILVFPLSQHDKKKIVLVFFFFFIILYSFLL